MSSVQLLLPVDPVPVRPALTPCERRGWALKPHHRARGLVDYDPRECRARILQLLSADRWTHLSDIFDGVRMHIDAVVRMLELLVRWGRIERTEWYHIYTRDGSPWVKPALKDYRGFTYVYRLRAAGDAR